MLRSIFVLSALSGSLLVSLPVNAETPLPPATRAEEVRPMLLGAQIPDVTLRNVNGKDVNLRALVGEKPTILVFYRGGWCPYCNVQLSALGQKEAELKQLGYQIVAVSPDRPDELKKSVEKNKIGYRLLSDSGAEAIRAFGLAFRVDDATVEKYRGYGIDLEKSSGAAHHLLPVPAVYVLNQKGVAQFSYVNPDYKMRLHPAVLMATARAALEAK